MMVWTKISDAFPRDPKIIGLSNAAFRAHITALCYCNEQLTDGALSKAAVKSMRITPSVVEDLVTAELWTPHPDEYGEVIGWRIVNYLATQKSREEVEEDQRKWHEAKVKGGQKRAELARLRPDGRVRGRFAPAGDQQESSSPAGDEVVPFDLWRDPAGPAEDQPYSSSISRSDARRKYMT